jgi:hypothetical protein
MDYMDHVLNVGAGSAVVSKVASADFGDEDARDWLVASLEKFNDDASQIDWSAEPRHSRVIAEAIEGQLKSGAINSQNTRNSLSALIYVPIMIRVFAGGEALKGDPSTGRPMALAITTPCRAAERIGTSAVQKVPGR